MRKVITAEKTLKVKKMAKEDRGEMLYDEKERVATITLVGVSQDTAERASILIARHTRKEGQ